MTLSSLIACPGCSHKLSLPDGFAGQRVQCPKCAVEFLALATAIPAMEVDTPAHDQAKKTSEPPPLKSAYASAPLPAADAPGAFIFCSECGVKYARSERACPACGCPIEGYADEPERDPRRRPRRRHLQPISEWLSLVAVILVPVGFAIMFAIMFISMEVMRIRGHAGDMVLFISVVIGMLIELAALVCILIWLYQAWRLVQHEDAEYTPGLMVGMLFIPVFNLYWMFRAIVGLSTALQEELHYIAPHRAHGAGWTPGLIACILMLIPYLQPFAVCMFLAWMLLANNAVHRLERYHRKWEEENRAPGDT